MDSEIYALPLSVRLERMRKLTGKQVPVTVVTSSIDIGGIALVLGLVFLVGLAARILAGGKL
jgi:hypothetical protein